MKKFMLIIVRLVLVAAATDAQAGLLRHRGGRQVSHATCCPQPQAVGHYYVTQTAGGGVITPGQPTNVVVTPSPQAPAPVSVVTPPAENPNPAAIRNPFAHGSQEHLIFEQGRRAGMTQVLGGRDRLSPNAPGRATGAVPPPAFEQGRRVGEVAGGAILTPQP